MSEAEAEAESQTSTTTDPLTIAAIITEFDAAFAGELAHLSHTGFDGMMEAEGEIRRGLIALNGAGLLAVISLLSQSFSGLIVRLAVGLYFAGVLFACVSWLFRAQSFRMLANMRGVLTEFRNNISNNPIMHKPISTAEELDLVSDAVKRSLGKIFKAMKRPGEHATVWTYLALGCFFVATATLVIDFEFSFTPKILEQVVVTTLTHAKPTHTVGK